MHSLCFVYDWRTVSRTRRIAELETELSKQEFEVAEAVARYRGIEAELESMRAGVALEDNLEGMARTDAILSVLHEADGSLSPSEVVRRLHVAGRNDQSRSVTATLAYLLQKGRIEKIGRGRYFAA